MWILMGFFPLVTSNYNAIYDNSWNNYQIGYQKEIGHLAEGWQGPFSMKYENSTMYTWFILPSVTFHLNRIAKYILNKLLHARTKRCIRDEQLENLLGGRSTKKIFAQGKIKWKKIHARQLTPPPPPQKIPAARKFSPPPPHNFFHGPYLNLKFMTE